MGERPQAAPTLDRPQMPAGYGIPDNAEGMLPWAHARDQLAQAPIYWIGSTRPDGRPHAMPIWGAVVDDTVYFEGSPETRRGRNLAANPAVVVHIENGPEVVILEGVAEEVATLDPALPGLISVSRPSEALAAKRATEGTFSALFLGLAGVALAVGGIGVANTMIVSVLERRREIGLRRALGASRGDIRGQFLTEAVLLSLLGGAAGIGAGLLGSLGYAALRHWLHHGEAPPP